MVSGTLTMVLFFVILLGILVYVLDWYKKKSLKKLIKNYDASENKSRREPPEQEGEPRQRGEEADSGAGRDTRVEEPDSNTSTPGNTEGQSSVPIPTPSSVGKDKPKPRKLNKLVARFRRNSK